MSKHEGAESTFRENRRKTRRKYSAEENIRIVLEGLCGEENIAELCRREEGIASNIYYSWSKEFLEAGKRRLMGDSKRQATQGKITITSPGSWSKNIGRFVYHYNNRRAHKSLDNLTPADVYHGKARQSITARNLVKEQTLRRKKRENLGLMPLNEKIIRPAVCRECVL